MQKDINHMLMSLPMEREIPTVQFKLTLLIYGFTNEKIPITQKYFDAK